MKDDEYVVGKCGVLWRLDGETMGCDGVCRTLGGMSRRSLQQLRTEQSLSRPGGAREQGKV